MYCGCRNRPFFSEDSCPLHFCLSFYVCLCTVVVKTDPGYATHPLPPTRPPTRRRTQPPTANARFPDATAPPPTRHRRATPARQRTPTNPQHKSHIMSDKKVNANFEEVQSENIKKCYVPAQSTYYRPANAFSMFSEEFSDKSSTPEDSGSEWEVPPESGSDSEEEDAGISQKEVVEDIADLKYIFQSKSNFIYFPFTFSLKRQIRLRILRASTVIIVLL